ncbi:alpha/beta hydrolase [Natrinema sp. CBA1119]|uniref:lipase/acyltransferase domain-containing protein n=1 Tax=Natrinema sp. CBA1119 TaxID=1608465 RepID=UPI000BF89DE5|nr:alpha/beta hydrolase [Natrinema sp. CBA1119]PGF16831.1 alpha/beta hydrolase [Natrinema sp. CBA1119]
MADTDSNRTSESDGLTTSTRRALLKATGTTIVGATGLAATTGSASAQLLGPDIEVIDVGSSIFGSGAFQSLPVEDELFIFVHGWFGDTTVESQAEDVAESMIDAGYEADTYVAIEWDATTINFAGATAETEDVGEELAEMLEGFYDYGGGNVRLIGHSLGGRVVLETINEIGPGYTVETVAPIGAAADGDMVCSGGIGGGEWYDGIEDNAEEVRNYHSENDTTVGSAYGGLFGAALGNDGAGCPFDTPDNYTDVDVTFSVLSHLGYLGDDEVGSDLAEAIEDQDSGLGWFS